MDQEDQDNQNLAMKKLKEILIQRGANPESYIKILVAFQGLIDSVKTHTDIETVAFVIKAFGIAVVTKHEKFHTQGGSQDERASASLN